jgi:hypothetical protein
MRSGRGCGRGCGGTQVTLLAGIKPPWARALDGLLKEIVAAGCDSAAECARMLAWAGDLDPAFPGELTNAEHAVRFDALRTILDEYLATLDLPSVAPGGGRRSAKWV